MDFTKILKAILSGEYTLGGTILCLVALYLFLKWKSTSALLRERKEEYRSLFTIVERIYVGRKTHKSAQEILVRNRECLGDLRNWKRNHDHIFSNKTVKSYYGLQDALKANPGGMNSNSKSYTKKQLDNMEKRRSDFSVKLQKDTDMVYVFLDEVLLKYIFDTRQFMKTLKERMVSRCK